ncbi:MAG: HEAT repeat domain-containing protein [Planctomycetia bacterium]|nr:HEAT repeat domain-containing protein [Planctomycetia bacterium]
MRSQSPEDFERVLADVRLVGDVSIPFGLHPLIIERVGLVTNLQNTGRDMPPSATRAMLISEMQRRGVDHPSKLLELPSVSAVIVRASLKPGIEKGDLFDVELSLPNGCETTSLCDGLLMPVRLREMRVAVADNQLHEGQDMGLAKGPLMEQPAADSDSPNMHPQARIPEGGVALQSRPMGMVIKRDEQSVRNSSGIASSVNQRFFFRRNGIKVGVATAKTDRYVELVMHPRYKDNVSRYFQVIRNVAISESPSQRQMRMQLLERQLLDAVTSGTAALRLEAIGADAKHVLMQGIASSDAEVRFYSAEALAYLDDPSAAGPLAAAARDESAFRARALTALSAMDDPSAYDELATLLDSPSAETRYGAFRALWTMNPRDPAVRGEKINNQFSLHRVKSKGPTMVHVTRTFRPEIVIFGADAKLRAPLILNAGRGIIVRDIDATHLSVSRFAPGQPDQKREISTSVVDLIHSIAEVGGTYPDVVQALKQAKSSGALECRLEIDAVPKNDRSYVRPNEEEEGVPGEVASAPAHAFPVDGPSPNLYPTDSPEGVAKPRHENQSGHAPETGAAAGDGQVDSAASPTEESGPAGVKKDSPAPGIPDETDKAAAAEAPPESWPLARRVGKMMGRILPAAPSDP